MPDNNKFVIRVPRTDLTKPMEAGIEAIRGAQNLIRQFGGQVEPALYSLLCDAQSDTRATVDKALKNGGQAASAVLIPLLISQFSIAPAIATMVAAVTVQAIATVGQEKLCLAMSAAGADRRARPAPAPAAPAPAPESEPKPKPRARTKTAKPPAAPKVVRPKPKPRPTPKKKAAK